MYLRGRKETHLDTIRYEIDMLDFSFARYSALKEMPDPAEPGETNACLECFLLHYRNLIEFLSDKPGRKDGTDLRIGEPGPWSVQGLEKQRTNKLKRADLYEKYWRELSVYLDHCTTYRTDEHPGWHVEAMYGELNVTLIEFVTLTHLTRQMRNGVRRGTVVFSEGANHTASFKTYR